MLSVELSNQLLHIRQILCRFPAGPYVTVIHPLYEMMELPVASLRVQDRVDLPFVRVIDDRQLRFRWRLGSLKRCVAVE